MLCDMEAPIEFSSESEEIFPCEIRRPVPLTFHCVDVPLPAEPLTTIMIKDPILVVVYETTPPPITSLLP